MSWFEIYFILFLTLTIVAITIGFLALIFNFDSSRKREKRRLFRILKKNGIHSFEQLIDRISEASDEKWNYQHIRNLQLSLFKDEDNSMNVTYDIYAFPYLSKIKISFNGYNCAIIHLKSTQIPFKAEVHSSWWAKSETDIRNEKWHTLYKHLKPLTLAQEEIALRKI